MYVNLNKVFMVRTLGIIITAAAFAPTFASGATAPDAGSPATTAPQAMQGSDSAPSADNSSVNVRDRSASSLTADKGSNEAVDRELMKQIRKSVVADKSLSTYAQNVKIIAENGKVTLKGPVKSDQEKQLVMSKATSIAGSGNVTDDLSVTTSP